jgi:hypothetical protein
MRNLFVSDIKTFSLNYSIMSRSKANLFLSQMSNTGDMTPIEDLDL